MPHLIHIEGSPRKQRSASLEVAHAFIAGWKARNAGGTVDVLDVWSTPMPEFDGDALDAKYAGIAGVALSKKQEKAWAEIKQLAGRITAADVILISSPMWNYGIPYKLKHLFDVVSQKDVLFTFDDRGQLGMLKDKKGVAMCARGVQIGEHFPKDKFDFQTTYLTMWFKMVGVTDISILEVEKGLFGPEIDAASRAEAVTAAKALAARI